jgi:adenylosuccinate synthase
MYYPDLYKLDEEVKAFEAAGGICPKIYCHPQTSATIIDDILLNMIAETMRGDDRHGSCGMGINECDLRTEAGFGITINKILLSDVPEIVNILTDIRKEYVLPRLEEIRKEIGTAENDEVAEMIEMLGDPAVIENAADEMKRNADRYVKIVYDTRSFLEKYDDIIFESGQGLMLDPVISPFSPHVTASRTGLYNPMKILSENGLKLTEAVYVTRSYVTRHGAGLLPYECPASELGITSPDETNVHNSWQGSIRYAKHGSADEFVKPVMADTRENSTGEVRASLFITHLNETDGKLLTCAGDIPAADFLADPVIKNVFSSFYFSYSQTGAEEFA